MTSDHSSRRATTTFQTQTQPPADCDCPIHAGRARDPFTAPLGLRFQKQVQITSLQQSTAERIYQAHHSYMDGELHPACLSHHGITYQTALTGAITYRFPLCSRKRLHFDARGQPVLAKEYQKSENIDELPDGVRGRARELAEFRADDCPVESVVVSGDTLVEVHRICLAVRMPNLASCGLARSQQTFFRSDDCPDSVNYLVTYVRADYPASMIKALRGKGWRYIGWSKPRQASNRDNKQIRSRFKWVFLCPIRTRIQNNQQTTLHDW